MIKIGKLFRLISLRWRTRHLERTTKSRTELRQHKVNFRGRNISIMDYIDKIAPCIPRVSRYMNATDHRLHLRKIYYKYDYAGLKFYIDDVNKKTDRLLRLRSIAKKKAKS